jgi:anti-sigma regulatory factor (Ser/Thr protein kinase)
VEDAILVLSELVTNAVRHSGAEADQQLGLAVRRVDRDLVISVRDSGTSGTIAAIRDNEQASFGGMGLRVVDQLSTDWGAIRESGSHTVWAKIRLE